MSVYVPVDIREEVTVDAGGRCGYCLTSEWLTGQELEIEHIIPTAAGGETVRAILWMACHRCNKAKSDQIEAFDPESGVSVRLFNPRTDVWRDHFLWVGGGLTVEGSTEIGRATVAAVQLNRSLLVKSRQLWIAWGEHPPN